MRKINKFNFWRIMIKNLVVLALVVLWLTPTVGLLISSVRDKEIITGSGWWTAFFTSESTEILRTASDEFQIHEGEFYVIQGNLFVTDKGKSITHFGLSVNNPAEHPAGKEVQFKGGTIRVETDGSYNWQSFEPIKSSRGKRIATVVKAPPSFTLANYQEIFTAERIERAFINSFTVTIPATIIPVLIAAYAAYALSWMRFFGRTLILIIIIGLLVVPLQMSLIPVLRFFTTIGEWLGVPGKGYISIWLAHTGFGLPLAVYLLYNYISSLPKEIIESAKMDGADHFKIFFQIILPLSIPALASFAIFQFLWVWNDLLVAMIFLGKGDDQVVLTSALRELLGSRGGNWEILTASAFVTIFVPIVVFLSLQRYFVRGLLSGSVK